jgi:predicted ester cyclase
MIARRTMRRFIATFSISALCISTSIWANEKLPEPEKLQVASGLSQKEALILLNTAKQYYAFWNTGTEAYAKRALAANFVDLNLPEGRLQGPKGPLIASAGFRQAVPDLSVTVKSVYLLKNKVISQLLFKGHFTGTFGESEGKGQEITFSAVDIYTIEHEKIIENWHLEDNLTLMQQLGLINKN